MKKFTNLFILTHILFMLSLLPVYAKEIIVPVEKIQVRVIVGSTSAFTGVAFDINLKNAMPDGINIDREAFALDKNNLPRFEIRDADDKIAFELNRSLIGAALYIIQMVDSKPDIIDALSNQTNYIFMSDPIKIKLSNGDFIVITPEVLKEATLKKIFLSEENRQRLIAARGGAQTLYQNKIDFGIKADVADSSRRVFALSFSYYGTPVESVAWWRFAAKGYVSSDKNDPISEIHLFPLTVGHVFGLENGKPFETGEVRGYFGIEGNQTFRKSRLNASFYYTTLLPNFIDLTFGSPNRLRLNPVIKFGAEYWDEINDNTKPDALQKGGKIGVEIYYYIPVMENYSLLVEGNFGYTLGKKFKEKNNVNDFISHFNVTLGYEVPGSDMKVLATYSFGQNDINFTEDTRLLLGLAINLFKSVEEL
ncbi:MAG: hypothetical protein WC879_07420 [Melioribacteraceae bacterium]